MALEHGVCNQLQFNLGNTGFMNVSSRFRDPQPLVIEKIGSSSVQPTNMNSPADVNLNLLKFQFNNFLWFANFQFKICPSLSCIM